jgi:hypothetical protein
MDSVEVLGSSKGEDDHGKHEHNVVVTVDSNEKVVVAGKYVVSTFKAIVGVAADRELNIVKDHKLHPLDDNAEIEVHEHEVFVSAPRGGGSS